MDPHQSAEGLCGVSFKVSISLSLPCNNLFITYRVCWHNASLQVRAAGELSGYAPAAQQEDHEEAEGGPQRPVQTSGQQCSSHH